MPRAKSAGAVTAMAMATQQERSLGYLNPSRIRAWARTLCMWDRQPPETLRAHRGISNRETKYTATGEHGVRDSTAIIGRWPLGPVHPNPRLSGAELSMTHDALVQDKPTEPHPGTLCAGNILRATAMDKGVETIRPSLLCSQAAFHRGYAHKLAESRLTVSTDGPKFPGVAPVCWRPGRRKRDSGGSVNDFNNLFSFLLLT